MVMISDDNAKKNIDLQGMDVKGKGPKRRVVVSMSVVGREFGGERIFHSMLWSKRANTE
jgi:hypothetical protein